METSRAGERSRFEQPEKQQRRSTQHGTTWRCQETSNDRQQPSRLASRWIAQWCKSGNAGIQLRPLQPTNQRACSRSPTHEEASGRTQGGGGMLDEQQVNHKYNAHLMLLLNILLVFSHHITAPCPTTLTHTHICSTNQGHQCHVP